jgi:hypothetical protein
VRRAFVHEASLRLEPGADPRGPGAAVTVELCGHWEHEGPCRWPHVAAIAGRSGDALALRVLFAAEPGDEAEVRRRIALGLRRGRVEGGPAPSGWTVLSASASELRDGERTAAERLAALP